MVNCCTLRLYAGAASGTRVACGRLFSSSRPFNSLVSSGAPLLDGHSTARLQRRNVHSWRLPTPPIPIHFGLRLCARDMVVDQSFFL